MSNTDPLGTVISQPTGTVGQFFFDVLHTTGGHGYGVWSLQNGTLPPGISIEPSGALIGTPTEAGTFTFTAKAVDLAGNTCSHAVTIAIEAP